MPQQRWMVSLHGQSSGSLVPSFRRRRLKSKGSERRSTLSIREEADGLELPPDPATLLTPRQLQAAVDRLIEWWDGKEQVLCLTGAGLSTESGIPDYRGHEGSYHRGHKPMVHDQFMTSEYQRKRYWGRSMVGFRSMDERLPNQGHEALAKLEQMGKLGVVLEDKREFYRNGEENLDYQRGQRRLALITQNVDGLHHKAGSKQIIDLHGRLDKLTCMSCGSRSDRRSFHTELESLNRAWLDKAREEAKTSDMRPDGDAAIKTDTYDQLQIPSCKQCTGGFLKPHVVFFGDTVPIHRVNQVRAAVDVADGLLVVGSSLAVHSAFRHVRAASQKGVPIALINVGETRAEAEGLPGILKIEAPAGPTLAALARHFASN